MNTVHLNNKNTTEQKTLNDTENQNQTISILGVILKGGNYTKLLISQFLGAFGDNYFLWLILGPLAAEHSKGLISDKELSMANALYTCLLYAPYVVLAPFAGFLSDRFAKSRCLVAANLIKIAGTILAMILIENSRFWIGLGYFIIGIGACIYSPAKYGILPEIVPHQLLVKANGVIEMLTIIAVLTGFLIGAVVVDNFSIANAFYILLIVYLISLGFAFSMEKTKSNQSVIFKENVSQFLNNAKNLLTNIRLRKILFGAALFWASGAILKMNFQPWGIEILHLKTNSEISLFSLWLAIGVMCGSVLAGHLHKVGDLSFTRYYGWMMGIMVAIMSVFSYESPMILIVGLLIITGVAGGLFLIPLNASLQWESHPEKRGKTIATLNLFDNLAMLIGGAVVLLILELGANPKNVFLFEGILIIVAVIFLKFPEKTDNSNVNNLNDNKT
jgi:LPLT family lysophospholipid transporter-like MFS transporter